jgi:hypothetical protein
MKNVISLKVRIPGSNFLLTLLSLLSINYMFLVCGIQFKIVICISRMRNRTLTNREKNCRRGRLAAETRQSRGRQRIS